MVRGMLDLLAHRGPDDSGIRQGDHWTLGHVRLSIIDLSSRGHQPMCNEDGSLWLTYNGEIYNYVELRKELAARGHRFRSDSDTEVILHAYEEWGPEAAERFVGMWAFALADDREQRLWLCRDRFGIKPLYYYLKEEFIVFASEIKALLYYLSREKLPLGLNSKSVQTYFQTGIVDGIEDCLIQGIRRFPPAHNFLCDADGSLKKRYWDVFEAGDGLCIDEPSHVSDTAEKLEALVEESVRLHLRSDVPLGVCLSGGLDSSSVVAMASKHVEPVYTFTTYFDEGPDYDERPYADLAAERFPTRPFRLKVEPGDLSDLVRDMLWYFDEPTLAYGIIPQWFIMKLASSEVKVLLDGQGGDELFAGYDFYLPFFLGSLFRERRLTALKHEVSGMTEHFGCVHALDKLTQGIASAEGMKNGDVGKFQDRLNDFLYRELAFSRLPALLRNEDRNSMAYSIESRVPFLDHRLVEFAFSLPSAFKVHHGWSKYVFRKAAAHFLPEAIAWRKDKKGFPTPFKEWAADRFRNELEALLLAPNSNVTQIMPAQRIREMLVRHSEGKEDLSWPLWRLFSYETWTGLLREGEYLRPKGTMRETAPRVSDGWKNPVEAVDDSAVSIRGDEIGSPEIPPEGSPSLRSHVSEKPVPYVVQRDEEVPECEPGAGYRVFFGPSEIVGYNRRNARALREMGVAARSVSFWDHRFRYGSDEFIRISGEGREYRANLEVLVKDLADRFDVFHFIYGRSLMPGYADVPLLKRLGKKIVMQFVGCDIRARDAVLTDGRAFNPCEICRIEPCRSSDKRAIAGFWEEHADVILSYPENSGLLRQPYRYLPLGYDLEYWKPFPVSVDLPRKGRSVLICHAPSASDLKGSRHVVEAVDRLKAEGHSVRLKLLEGVSFEEVREWINACDVFVDQLLTGWHGAVSIEAMSLGKPAVCYLEPRYLEEHEEHGYEPMPIVNADPSNLYERLKSLTLDRELREQLGRRGRAYVERVHDIRSVAAQLKEIYDTLMFGE